MKVFVCARVFHAIEETINQMLIKVNKCWDGAHDGESQISAVITGDVTLNVECKQQAE